MNRTQDCARASRTAITIRRADSTDLAALSDFFAGLSVRARYLRFFAAITPTAAMLRVLCGGGGNIDAVIATHGGAIVGHAMAADSASPDGAGITEIGVVVTDSWQGRGVGSALMRALITGARARGVTTMTMDVLPGNQHALAMITGHWPAARAEHTADTVSVRVLLARHRHEPRDARPAATAAPPAIAGRGQRRPAIRGAAA